MNRRAIAGIALLGLVMVAAGVALAGPASSDGQFVYEQQQDDDFDRTTFEITVFDVGTAQWTVRHSRILNEDEIDQFETFADEFRSEELEVYENFQARGERLTESGTEATGREMTATDFQRDAFVDERGQPRGVIEMSFNWTNFAVVDEQADERQVVVADVFAGGWTIVDEQQFVVRTGPNLVFESVEPNDPAIFDVESNLTASQTVTWNGYYEFTNNRPRVVLTPPGEATTNPGTADDEPESDNQNSDERQVDDGDDESENNDDSMGFPLLAAVVALLVVVAAGGGFAWQVLARDGGDTTVAESGAAEPTADESEPEAAVAEAELVSDEDRVLNLLEDNGGRMKQVVIVEETDWSKSKVSMLLSEMEEDGQISKLRVGRENIISIAGQEPEAARSPFEDET